MNLNTFVLNNLDKQTQATRDFIGPRGWVFLTNIILRDLESLGFFSANQKKEVGVEVNSSYWITIPSDLRTVEKIFVPNSVSGHGDPDAEEQKFSHSIVNGMIRLNTAVGKNTSPTAATLSSWATTHVAILDAASVANAYQDDLLVVTNGDASGQTMYIASSAASDGTHVVLTLANPLAAAPTTSTTGYITDEFLMLRYLAAFTVLSAYTDALPFLDKYQNVLVAGLYMLSLSRGSDQYAKYQTDYENAINTLGLTEFTPTADQARPRPRVMPGYQALDDNSRFPDPERDLV
jgi:hypothetical protein